MENEANPLKSIFSTLNLNLKPYRVISPLNHDNVDYPPGSEVELSDDAAKPLLGTVVMPV